jgi:hypothetical protein
VHRFCRPCVTKRQTRFSPIRRMSYALRARTRATSYTRRIVARVCSKRDMSRFVSSTRYCRVLVGRFFFFTAIEERFCGSTTIIDHYRRSGPGVDRTSGASSEWKMSPKTISSSVVSDTVTAFPQGRRRRRPPVDRHRHPVRSVRARRDDETRHGTITMRFWRSDRGRLIETNHAIRRANGLQT